VRIAVLCHYFWPEPGAPSARLLGLGRSWLEMGHEVTVVTNLPNHPTGVIREGYRGRSFLIEDVQGIRVIRCRTYATPNRGFLRKSAGHLNFMIQSYLQATGHLHGVDVLIASSPTLFAVVSAWAMSRRLRIPYVFEVRDLWPAIFADLGVIRNRVVLRALEGLELFLYRGAAAVVTVTRSFAENISSRGIDPARIRVVSNGVDLRDFAPEAADPAVKARFGFDGRFVVLYAGAHGISHALHRVLEAAALLRDDPRIRFLLVGEGAEKERLVSTARERGLENVTFVDPVSREEMPALYRAADVCLVPLRAIPLFRSFVPSKMFEILACGCPIVASLEGEAAEILTASGGALVVPPEDVSATAGAIRKLAADERLRAELAGRGRPFVAAHYEHRALAARYADVLASVGTREAEPSRARKAGAA
jgi:glycosyltransferase involved in cell wall biosynthesis